jgi:aconitate hydratase
VRAVIAESFERIHRSNLIGMGVAPLQFLPGQSVASLKLSGREVFDIAGLSAPDAREVTVTATPEQGPAVKFKARLRIDTPKEREYYRHGGILQFVLRQLAAAGPAA